MPDPIRIFIGTEPKTELARLVLQHSILRHTDVKVEFVPMIGPKWEYPTEGLQHGTGFSLRRWMIPAYCNWQGWALYLDADMLVFSDIHEIWRCAQYGSAPDCHFWCTHQIDKFSTRAAFQTSVMLINCAAVKNNVNFQLDKILEDMHRDDTVKNYQRWMHGQSGNGSVGVLDTAWNHMCRYHEGKTKLLHYTSVPSQPWYDPEDKLAYPWKLAFQQGINACVIPRSMIDIAITDFGKDERGEPTGLHPYYREFTEARRREQLRKAQIRELKTTTKR